MIQKKTDRPSGYAKITILLLGSAFFLAACGTPSRSGDQTAANKPSAKQISPDQPPDKNEMRITIENFVFSPAEVTVAPGTKVTWINKDEAPHTATSVDNKFNSGGLDTDDKFSFVFNERGEYPYICTLHPHMKAIITVK